MKPNGHLVVRASAGSGKTHRLSSRYLALLFAGAEPESILATTFTRKAAHEILERILKRLADGARGKGLPELEAALGRPPSSEECLDQLARLLRRMDRLRVGTIDAFFAQIARLYALDLGLPAAWRIADDAEGDVLASEAVGEALAGASRLEMLELLQEFQRNGAGRSVHDALLEFARSGKDVLQDSATGAWERIRPLPPVEKAVLDTAIGRLPELALPTTKQGKPNASWRKCRDELVDAVARGAWREVLGSGLGGKVRDGESEYAREPITADHRAVLKPLVDHALHLETSGLFRQNRAARALLLAYADAYERASRARGLLGFGDVPHALATAAGLDLAHRLDGRIEHLLLDEFQDTAPVQWRVLRPIAEAILRDAGGAKSFFCVGDEKQSIYAWRGGERELLAGLAAKRPEEEREELHVSYRSSCDVLLAVNQVFEAIGGSPAFRDSKGEERTEAAAAARQFQAAFRRHELAPERKRPGTVLVVRAPASESASDRPATLDAAVERVGEILAEAPRAKIGILMRRRRWIPELIHSLRVKGFAASDEGGNPLTDSQAVLEAISLLRLADHPGDRAAAFHVATSPLGAKVGLAADLVAATSVARAVRAGLASLGYGGYLASIRPAASDGYGPWDARRFGQLVDLALAWEPRAGSRPSAFVEHVRATKVEDPSAAQVRVMTVHGSKGLEFDAVVLPDLDGQLGRREDGLLTLRPDPEGPIEIVTHGLPKEICAAHAELERVRADVARRRATEELCVLYVAMTRAVHRLDLIVEAPRKGRSGHTYAAIVRGALGIPDGEEPGVVWRSPDTKDPWFAEELGRPAEAERRAAEKARLRFAPSRRARSLAGASPSGAKDLVAFDARRLLAPIESITARGRILHRLLEEVEWIETFQRTDEELLAIGRRIEPDEDAGRSAVAELRAILAHPEAKRALAKPGDDARVWRERRFALVMPGADGTESLWNGAFDRVVLRPGSAEIVDFKTDRVVDAESYRPQMEAYRRALSRITELDEASIATTLLFVGGDGVERVSLEPAAGSAGSGSGRS